MVSTTTVLQGTPKPTGPPLQIPFQRTWKWIPHISRHKCAGIQWNCISRGVKSRNLWHVMNLLLAFGPLNLMKFSMPPKICLRTLKALSFNGCPFEGSARSLTWKLLLNYLPTDKSLWMDELKRCRNSYRDYILEFIVRPGVQTNVNHEDHPLNSSPSSQWAAYFKDNEMLLQIYKDCRRLCPDLNFFQKATEFTCESIVGKESPVDTLRKRVEFSVLQSETLARNRSGGTNVVQTSPHTNFFDDYDNLLRDGEEAHWEVASAFSLFTVRPITRRAMFRGMNEVLGPIYYVLANDPDMEWRRHAEADTFFLFYNLMTEIQTNFIKSLDDDQLCGISGKMKEMNNLLRDLDYTLWQRMTDQGLVPEYFAFRWITLMLSQEFTLPDVLRLWDSLLGDEKRFKFLLYVCCAMLILIRDDLLKKDFSTAMKLVQNFPLDDINKVLQTANEYYMRRGS